MPHLQGQKVEASERQSVAPKILSSLPFRACAPAPSPDPRGTDSGHVLLGLLFIQLPIP